MTFETPMKTAPPPPPVFWWPRKIPNDSPELRDPDDDSNSAEEDAAVFREGFVQHMLFQHEKKHSRVNLFPQRKINRKCKLRRVPYK